MQSSQRLILSALKGKEFSSSPLLESYFERMLISNLNGGKQFRGNLVLQTFMEMTEKTGKEAKKRFLPAAHAVAWSMELMQAQALIADDIMDGSLTRRGQAAWYTKPDVGLGLAVNDVISLHTAVYQVLRSFVQHHPHYREICNAVTECYHTTASGQALDLLLSSRLRRGDLKIDAFDQKLYEQVVEMKTSWYTFWLPLQVGLLLATEVREENHSRVRESALQMGHLFQAHDDYMDCFGDPAVTGKDGRDIEEGKCCWPIVAAVTNAEPSHLEELKQNYGQPAAVNIKQVKQVYRELNLEQMFREEVSHRMQCTANAVKNMDGNLPIRTLSQIITWLKHRINEY